MSSLPFTPQAYEPSSAYSGANWTWVKSFSSFSSLAYTLTYNFVGSAGTFQITAGSYNSSSDFLVNVAGSATSAFPAGYFTWTSFISDGSGNTYQVGTGNLTVLANPAIATSGEARSVVKQTLDGINNLILYRTTGLNAQGQPVQTIDVFESVVGGQVNRQLRLAPIQDLMKIRDRYQALYNQEVWKAQATNGLDTPDNVRVNFQKEQSSAPWLAPFQSY